MNDLRKWMRLVEGLGAVYVDASTLYHGTNTLNAGRIVASQSIISGDDQMGDLAGVSLTTSIGAAKDFAADRCNNMMDDDVDEDFRGAVFAFDPVKLRTQCRLNHYTDGGNDDENEVRAFSPDDAIDLTALTAIYVDVKEIEWLINYFKETQDSYNRLADLYKLRSHPLLMPKV